MGEPPPWTTKDRGRTEEFTYNNLRWNLFMLANACWLLIWTTPIQRIHGIHWTFVYRDQWLLDFGKLGQWELYGPWDMGTLKPNICAARSQLRFKFISLCFFLIHPPLSRYGWVYRKNVGIRKKQLWHSQNTSKSAAPGQNVANAILQYFQKFMK